MYLLYSYYNWQKNKMERSITEYFRALPGIGRFVGNNVYFYTMGNMNIYHGYTNLTWYEYTGVRCFTNFKTYPYNKKRLIKGTILEYAPLKEFQKYFFMISFGNLCINSHSRTLIYH